MNNLVFTDGVATSETLFYLKAQSFETDYLHLFLLLLD